MLNIHIPKAVLYCLYILVLFACTDFENEANPAINISDEFHIDMYQSLDQSIFDLILDISTSENYGCENYKIGIDYFNTSSGIELTFNDILAPEFCEEGTGSAITLINIPEKDLNQRVRFSFTDEIYDEADLTIDANTVELDFMSNNGIKFFISKLHRIPINTLTCVFKYDISINQVEIEEKLNVLTQIVKPTILTDGYYGYFSVEEQKIVAKNNPYSFSLGLHYDISTLSKKDLSSFENQLSEIQNLLSDELSLDLFKTY